MTPKQVVELWLERFNAADAHELADLYHVDAVNHQVVQEPVIGRDAIRANFEREFATATMVCSPCISPRSMLRSTGTIRRLR
jgi:ketosteroid isomerase-like protein